MTEKIIGFLLENGGASIKYRVKKEILHISTDTDEFSTNTVEFSTNTVEMKALQEKILNLPRVKKAFACQKENGFFGSVIHGGYFDGFDSTVDLLKRYGVEIMINVEMKMKSFKQFLMGGQIYDYCR